VTPEAEDFITVEEAARRLWIGRTRAYVEARRYLDSGGAEGVIPVIAVGRLYRVPVARLEGIAESFKGVSKSFALQAGREIRIMVESDRVTDDQAVWLSRDIARRIESELEYPGQIKVTVIRETRAVEYAK